MISKPDSTDGMRHVDDLLEYNADPGWAVNDDNELYWIDTNNWNGRTGRTHERYVLTEETLRQREGAGEPCDECGHTIPAGGIIVRKAGGNYHIGCHS